MPVRDHPVRRRHKIPATALPVRKRSRDRRMSSEFSQLAAELPSGPEERVFDGFFTGAQGVANSAQLQALVVLHFENDALARRQPLHRTGEPFLDFLPDQVALGIGRWPLFLLALKEIGDALFIMRGMHLGSLIFGAGLAAAEMVEADVGDDAIKPGVKAAFETEAVQVAVDLQEGFLVDVTSVLGALHQVQGEAKDVAVVTADKLLEREPAAGLGFLDKGALFKLGQRGPRCQRGTLGAGPAAIVR